MKSVSFITLGCKVNKYESDCMANILKENNYKIVEDFSFADYYVINTCAVTNEGEKKSRQAISRVLNVNPNAKIIICGCASENNLEQFLKNKNVISVFGNENKEQILDYLNNSKYEKIEIKSCYNGLQNPLKTTTRAHLKIQDGCNNFCSYCLIPYIRGRSRSRNIDEIIAEAKLLDKDFAEIVLVGIDLSDYKINGKLALGELLLSLKNLNCRIRIGSLEERIITEEFMKILSTIPNFAPHFHLSLQSGSDKVLKDMNRKYTCAEYKQKCELIKKYFADANITTDIIVGFPTETEINFNQTCEFVKQIGFGKIHIFPYSKRDGTLASKFTEISSKIKKERVKIMQSISNDLSLNYLSKFIGKTLRVIFEEEDNNFWVGYTDNYIKIYLNKENFVQFGKITNVLAKEIYLDGIKGEIL